MGDFNWLTPDFLAFASPQHKPVEPVPESSPRYKTMPKTVEEVEMSTTIPEPFKNVLAHFTERNVGLVVRLNSELYCPTYFTALGINHLDMIFDDGTCPQLPMVRKFIKLSHDMINDKKRGIAVHCKAGLGRTGCLIGAYLIYRYGFTANELIAFMRFMRPGMVVGPQQHWLHLNQGKFREWWWQDQYKEKLALVMPLTPTKSVRSRINANGQVVTPNGASKRSALGEIDDNAGAPAAAAAMDECLPAPTPGQPRKTSRMNSPVRAYSSANQFGATEEEKPTKEIVEVRTHRKSQAQGEDESEEEWMLRTLSRRTSSKSPVTNSDKKRAISYTTTTTTTRYSTLDEEHGHGALSDVENWQPLGDENDEGFPMVLDSGKPHAANTSAQRPKTPGSTKSGSGSGTLGMAKVRGLGSASPRRSGSAAASVVGIRKTSGRVGSVSAARTLK
jgi:cell division cycle 14